MSERRRLREVFNRHSSKVVELRELAECLAHEVDGGQLSLMPHFKFHDLPMLALKALQIKLAKTTLMKNTAVQKKLRAAMNDGSLGFYCDSEDISYFTDINGHTTVSSRRPVEPENIRSQYIKLSQQVFFTDTPSLRALAFGRIDLTSLALLADIPKDKLIPALEAALSQCTDHSPSVANGTIKPVPLGKIFG